MATTQDPGGPFRNTPAPAPPPAQPWDDAQAQLRALVDNQAALKEQIRLANAQYQAAMDAPLADQLVDAAAHQAGLTNRGKLFQATLDASKALEDNYRQAVDASTQIATLKERAAEASVKLQQTPEETARLQAEAAAATKQAELYGAQADEWKARTAQAASPEGKAKDAADKALVEAQTRTQEAQAASDKAQADKDTATANLIAAQAAAYPAESTSTIGVQGAQAKQYAAQAEAAAAATAVDKWKLHEAETGALGIFIEQQKELMKRGLISQQQAEANVAAQVQATQTGATPYEWQQQRDLNTRTLAGQIMQSGAATAPGQQYMVGGEPGGAIQQALKGWGINAPTTRLNPTSVPAYMASMGMTSGPQSPTLLPASGAGGAVSTAAPPAYAQGVGQGIPDYSHLSKEQVDAMFAQARQISGSLAPAQQPAAQPASAGTTVVVHTPAATTTPLQAGGAMGGVGNGLALSPIITGAPNYARNAP